MLQIHQSSVMYLSNSSIVLSSLVVEISTAVEISTTVLSVTLFIQYFNMYVVSQDAKR